MKLTVIARDDVVAYAIEAGEFAALLAIEKALFGDGSQMTPDIRRDLANRMHLALGSAVPLATEVGPAEIQQTMEKRQ